MDIILKNVKKKDFPVLKSLAKSLGFEIVTAPASQYKKEFVDQILQASEEVKNGEGIKMSVEDLDKLWK